METLRRLFRKYKELIAYLFWGGMTTLVSWGTYSLFVSALHLGDATVTAANALSWVCAVLFAFVTNKVWVFGSRSWEPGVVLPELWKFVAARLLTGAVELVGVPLLVRLGLDQTIFGVEGMLSKVLVSIVVVILNYVFSRLLVFRRSRGER